MRRLPAYLLIVAGSLFVGLGLLGIVLPLLPTTPFLLLAAYCYARSSERFYCWLMHNRILGEYIRNYREGRGMSVRQKAATLGVLWVTLVVSGSTATTSAPLRLFLLAVGGGVTWLLLRLPTRRNAPTSGPDRELPSADAHASR